MPEDFDVVIVGARCAGSSLAIRLARAGLSVCVVDRAVFPSDTPSTHAIQASGVAALDELGARQEAEATTTPVTRAVVALGSARAHVEDLPALLGAPMLNVRRVTLDAILVNQAASVGADVRCDISVTGLEVAANGRVTGVKTTTGPITARLVVGADGIRSTIAKHVGAREYAATDPGRAFAWGYLSDFDLNASDVSATVWIGKPDVNGYLASQTDAGLFMAVASVDLARKPEFLRDREAAYKASFAEWPELGAVVSSGTLVGPVRLMSGWHGFFRESAGPGWALVGDAGHFKDPTPGQGISDALRQTRQLASTIEAAMGGTTQLDEALRGYWQWRDDDAWPMYWFAHDLGAPGPTPPLQAEVQRRIATDHELTERLARVLNHEISPSALTPPNVLAGAAASALVHPRGSRRHVFKEAAALIRQEMHRFHLHRLRPKVDQGPTRSRH